MKAGLLKQLKRFVPQRLRIMRLRRKADGILSDWAPILAAGAGGRTWLEIRTEVQSDAAAPKVLMATSVGGHLAAVQFDALIAVALTLRGANVSFLLCDAALPACMMDQHDWYPDRRRFLHGDRARGICMACWPVGEKYLAPLGLPILRLSGIVSSEERQRAHAAADAVDLDKASHWKFAGLPVGEHGLAGALRFHARADLEGIPYREAVLRAYLRAGAVSAQAAVNIPDTFAYDVMVAHHGIYVPQGLWAAAARAQQRRVVTWNPAYRTNSFVLSEQDSYHKTMISEDTALWERLDLRQEQRARLMDYLKQRRRGDADWISFTTGKSGQFSDHVSQLGLDPDKPTVALLTSVMWDAQLHYESNAFPSQLAWLDATIEHFSRRRDLNLVIRVHPAELSGMLPSEQRVADHVKRRHGRLPRHIALVGPESPLNTYVLTDGCDCALVYSTKTGIELSAVGTPVVVAGEAWIRNKGFSIDATSPQDYEEILRTLPLRAPLEPEQRRRAERYAWHFFFRRMVELPGFEKRSGWPPYRLALDRLEALAPGADENLDMVCERILAGGPFLAPRSS